MIWLENNVIDITTKRVFYYSSTKEPLIDKICDNLGIDIFPSLDPGYYYRRGNNIWTQHNLSNEQKIQYDEFVFNSKIIKQFETVPSNILFVFEKDIFRGLLHFTDYGKKIIHESLYRSFFEFEKRLRQFLVNSDCGYESFLKYLEYKQKKRKKDCDGYKKRVDEIKAIRDEYPHLSCLTLRELLLFSISGFHSSQIIDFDKSAVPKDKHPDICSLRNMIMHCTDSTGMSETLPHNFDAFRKNFFEVVISFKNAFRLLADKIENTFLERRKIGNERILEYLASLDENQLKNKFSDYDKYI